jgi:hypothetical protein
VRRVSALNLEIGQRQSTAFQFCGAFFAGRRPMNQLCHTTRQTAYENARFHSLPGRTGKFLRDFYSIMTTTARPGVSKEESKKP